MIEVFAGIGGFRLGCEPYFKTVYAVDIDKDCKKTYDINFKTPKLTCQDVMELDIKSIPEFDIFTAGFPCQPFSIAGLKKGLDDVRGDTLMNSFLKIIKVRKPCVVFLENVKNFHTINNGEAYNKLTSELKKYGYYIKSKVINTHTHSILPQNRERIYIVAFNNKHMYDDFKFPNEVSDTTSFRDLLETKVNDKYYYTKDSKIYDKLSPFTTKKNTVYQYRRGNCRENKKGIVPTLTANMGTGGHNVGIILTNDNKIRKLTPRECFNFQGFPKTFKLSGVSDSKLYKQIGNSVSIPIINKIAKCISLVYNKYKNKENEDNI